MGLASENEKDNAANERNAGKRGRNVGRKPGRFWRIGGRRRRRRFVRHHLVTQDERLLCQLESLRERTPKGFASELRKIHDVFSPLPFSKGEDEGERLAAAGSARRLLTLALSSNPPSPSSGVAGEEERESNECLTLWPRNY